MGKDSSWLLHGEDSFGGAPKGPGLLVTQTRKGIRLQSVSRGGGVPMYTCCSFLPFFRNQNLGIGKSGWWVRWSLPLSHPNMQSGHHQGLGNYSESHCLQGSGWFGSRLRLAGPCKQGATFAQCCLCPVIPMGSMLEQHRQLSFSARRWLSAL